MIALLADVHSNLEALVACVKHARESGAERFVFLGDLVGYGADPQRVVDLIADMAGQGAVVIKGNHDEAIARDSLYMNETARAAIVWTRGVLSDPAKRFLASRPLCVKEESMCFVHASAAEPARWDYVDGPAAARRSAEAAQATYVFSGHVHDQVLYFQGRGAGMNVFRPVPGNRLPVAPHRRWLAIVGSVGQPRDGNPAAAYALFDPVRHHMIFRRIAYDNYAAAEKVRKAGLPFAPAYRLERGV